jgi:hypothetical protein
MRYKTTYTRLRAIERHRDEYKSFEGRVCIITPKELPKGYFPDLNACYVLVRDDVGLLLILVDEQLHKLPYEAIKNIKLVSPEDELIWKIQYGNKINFYKNSLSRYI